MQLKTVKPISTHSQLEVWVGEPNLYKWHLDLRSYFAICPLHRNSNNKHCIDNSWFVVCVCRDTRGNSMILHALRTHLHRIGHWFDLLLITILLPLHSFFWRRKKKRFEVRNSSTTQTQFKKIIDVVDQNSRLFLFFFFSFALSVG
jgi:hypothetical protein